MKLDELEKFAKDMIKAIKKMRKREDHQKIDVIAIGIKDGKFDMKYNLLKEEQVDED